MFYNEVLLRETQQGKFQVWVLQRSLFSGCQEWESTGVKFELHWEWPASVRTLEEKEWIQLKYNSGVKFRVLITIQPCLTVLKKEKRLQINREMQNQLPEQSGNTMSSPCVHSSWQKWLFVSQMLLQLLLHAWSEYHILNIQKPRRFLKWLWVANSGFVVNESGAIPLSQGSGVNSNKWFSLGVSQEWLCLTQILGCTLF